MKKTIYQRSIMERFMSEDELNTFHANYKKHTKPGRKVYTPTDLDIETLKKWLSGEYNDARAAAIMGVSKGTVASRAGLLIRKGLLK